MELSYGDYGIGQAEMLILIIPAILALYYLLRKGGVDRRKIIFLLIRFTIITLIALSLSTPYIIRTNPEFEDIVSITILSDQSESMRTSDINKNLTEELYKDIKTAVGNLTGKPGTVELRYFSEGNRTEIGNALYQETLRGSREKSLILLLSDGNNNYGRDAVDMANALRNENTTVYALIPETTQQEVYVARIGGDKKTPANADYTLKIDIGKAGSGKAEYSLNLRVDDNLIHIVNNIIQEEEVKSIRLTFSVKDEGTHKITVEIKPKSGDYIKENNEIIKSVDVVEKPGILLVSESTNSQLSTLLNENYRVDITKSPRQDYSKYDAVYLDNQPAIKLDNWVVNSLHQYITDGSGLVVVGGDKSYEKGDYYNRQIETLLPVMSTEPPEKKRKELAIVFLMDISQSTGYGLGGETKVDVEKALAINILQQLDPEDMVGAIAFNVDAYTISPLRKLSEIETELEDKIRSLRFGGGTDMMSALVRAENLIENRPGDKYVIIISDGVIKRRAMQEPTLLQVDAMTRKGISVYTVGVGFDTDEAFMNAIATAGKGIYFKPGEYERLKMEFEEKEKEEKDQYSLGVYNRYHFITRDLVQFWPSIKEFNGVTEKSIAQVLITNEGKMPIVTVWRFGLGRVVSLTTDNGLLWAPNIYYSNSGELISAITNWAIGDLEKRKRVNIETADINLGDKAEIRIKSDKQPALILQDTEGNTQEITLKQTDVDIFYGETTPEKPGLYRVKAASNLGEDTDAFAIDIPREHRNLGINTEELNTITGLTGGKTYSTTERDKLKKDILEYAKKGSYRETIQKTPIQIYLTATALSLFFLDVITRRILDIIRLRRKK